MQVGHNRVFRPELNFVRSANIVLNVYHNLEWIFKKSLEFNIFTIPHIFQTFSNASQL